MHAHAHTARASECTHGYAADKIKITLYFLLSAKCRRMDFGAT